MAKRIQYEGGGSGERLLFLTDGQLSRGIEAMYFAYRSFTADPDRILAERGLGRAHHRALHFIAHRPDTTVKKLIGILGVSKQSLNRVLRDLVGEGLVESRIDAVDRRKRHLKLTQKGRSFERLLGEGQRRRMREAYKLAGPEAVAGFRAVLDQIMDPDLRAHFLPFADGG